MSRRDAVLMAVTALALGAGLMRLVSPPGATRRLSAEGLEIKTRGIQSGETVVQETKWVAPDDVYVVGWSPELGATGAQPRLFLRSGDMSLFVAAPALSEGSRAVFVPAGTGFLLKKGEALTLRLEITNSGPAGETFGARAIVYFHPVAWR